MQLLNYALNKYGLKTETLPADLKQLVEGYYSLSTQAETDEQIAKAAAFEKIVAVQVAQYGEANKPIESLDESEPEPTPPQYEGGESVTFRLNGGEPYPKYKGKFYWVAMITGASQKYQLERQFISERIDENNQWLTSAILHEGNFYEIKDGYDNYFVTVENGQIKKLTKDEIIARFNAPKREPREPKPTPSVKEPKQDTASDMPFAQYLAIIEQYREFKELRDKEKYYSKNHKFESFIDSEGNIYLKVSYNTDRDEKETVNWTRIGKGGANQSYYPNSQFRTEYFEFVKGKLYGTALKKEDGWFRPCDKDGNVISFVNGKIVESNAKRISELGYEIKEINSYKGRAVLFKDKTPPTAVKIGEPELKPFALPTRMRVPDAKREPHYKAIENNMKLNSLIIKQEILLGKMEIAQYKYFDGMQDMYQYYRENELVWHTPQVAPDIHYSERLYASDNRINWGNHYIRYNGKKGNAYVYLDSENQKPQAAANEKPAAAVKPANDTATAQKFYKTAESLRKKSKDWYDSHRNSLVNTPKRQREYNSGAIYADIMKEKAEMYEAIGKAYENGNLPNVLKDISPAIAQNDLERFVYSIETPSYYAINGKSKSD